MDSFCILIVDDHPESAQLLAQLLEFAGYKVRSTTKIDDALRIAAAEQIDLLITDINIPKIDGRRLLNFVRAMRPQRTRPLQGIAMSAFTSSEDIAENLAAGYRAHLSEPFDTTELLRLIESIRADPTYDDKTGLSGTPDTAQK